MTQMECKTPRPGYLISYHFIQLIALRLFFCEACNKLAYNIDHLGYTWMSAPQLFELTDRLTSKKTGRVVAFHYMSRANNQQSTGLVLKFPES